MIITVFPFIELTTKLEFDKNNCSKILSDIGKISGRNKLNIKDNQLLSPALNRTVLSDNSFQLSSNNTFAQQTNTQLNNQSTNYIINNSSRNTTLNDPLTNPALNNLSSNFKFNNSLNNITKIGKNSDLSAEKEKILRKNGRNFCKKNCEKNYISSGKKCLNGNLKECQQCKYKNPVNDELSKKLNKMCSNICNYSEKSNVCRFYPFTVNIVTKKYDQKFLESVLMS